MELPIEVLGATTDGRLAWFELVAAGTVGITGCSLEGSCSLHF